MAHIVDALTLAIEHHRAGRLNDAADVYRQILATDPAHPEALHLLGVVAHQQGQHVVAVDLIRQALELQPSLAVAYCNLGVVLQELRQLDDAEKAFRQAIELRPNYSEAYFNLGNLLQDRGAWNDAIAIYNRVLAHKPKQAAAYSRIGAVLSHLGQFPPALAAFRAALAIEPQNAEVLNSLGITLRKAGRLEEAIAVYRQAIAFAPGLAKVFNNLGVALLELRSMDEAIAAFQQAIRLDSNYAEAFNNLGNVYKDQGKLNDAIDCYQHAMKVKPDLALVYSNYLYTLNFCPGYDAHSIGEEHRKWNEQFAEPLAATILPHANTKDPNRPLRIGYVSPDFWLHPVGRFMLPLLTNHDHDQFQIYCYSSTVKSDSVTKRTKELVDVWRDVANLSDEQLAALVREDEIDILVDLSMHMGGNRLLAFARKPAPVQVTYLAYPGTTGLRTIDYRLTDVFVDPPEFDDGRYSEVSYRLPETAGCYRPATPDAIVNELPAFNTGHITFGCLNNFCKVTSATLETWGNILHAVPDSHLRLHVAEGKNRDEVRRIFESHGVAAEQLEFTASLPLPQYFAQYHRIDIILDPFPYGGATTTCDAMWMGVPVITLAGETAASRCGLSNLSNVGLAEFVTYTVEEYERRAVETARDLERLSELRRTMRERMLASPLMDAPRFARNVEASFRHMWQNYCQS